MSTLHKKTREKKSKKNLGEIVINEDESSYCENQLCQWWSRMSLEETGREKERSTRFHVRMPTHVRTSTHPRARTHERARTSMHARARTCTHAIYYLTRFSAIPDHASLDLARTIIRASANCRSCRRRLRGRGRRRGRFPLSPVGTSPC